MLFVKQPTREEWSLRFGIGNDYRQLDSCRVVGKGVQVPRFTLTLVFVKYCNSNNQPIPI